MDITPEQARVELARRELARRNAEVKQTEPTAYSEIASPLLSGASSAAFGVPKYLVGKIGGEKAIEQVFPEQQTLGGKALRVGAEGAGLVAGGAARLGMGVAGKVIPKLASSGLGLKAGVGAIDAANRAKLVANIGRGAITGGVGGATQIINPDTNVEQQITQGLSGAVVGGAIPLVGTLKGVGRSLRRSAQVGKPSKVGEREVMRGQLSSRIREMASGVGRGVSGASEKLSSATSQITDALKQTTKQFHDNLSVEAEKGFNKFQEFVPKYFKEATRTYGETLDGMIDGLSKVKDASGKYIGKNIPTEEATGLLSKVQQEAEAIGITDSPIISKVRSLVEKYSDEGMNGRVDVRTFLKDVREARDSVSAGVKEGSKYLSHKDMTASILNDNVGDFLTKFLPEGQLGSFKDLQSAYKPIIDAKKTAYKLFQPYKEGLGGAQGFNLLKKLGRSGIDQITPQERNFINALESGSSFGKGAGNVTEQLRKMKPELIKQQIQAGIDKKTAETAFNRFKMLAENRKSELSTRNRRVTSIIEAQKQAEAIKSALAIGGAALSIGAGGVAVMRGLGAEKQVQQLGN
jgi:hypothetical protein